MNGCDANMIRHLQQARVQFRLTGSITCVDAHEISPELKQARIDQWRGLSDAARVQFRYPPPGETRRVPADGSDPYLPEAPCRETPEPTFALLLLEPNTVDIVNLRENQRTLHRRLEGQCWEETAINP